MNDVRTQIEKQPGYKELHMAFTDLLYHMKPHATQRRTNEHGRKQIAEKLMNDKSDREVFELDREGNSVRSEDVVGHRRTGRVTEALNLSDLRTVTTLHAIVRVAGHMNIDVHHLICIPCMAGCTRQKVNRNKGCKAGQVNCTEEVSRVCRDPALYVRKIEAEVEREEPETNDLRHHNDVQLFMDKWKQKPASIVSPSVGMAFNVPGCQDEIYSKKH